MGMSVTNIRGILESQRGRTDTRSATPVQLPACAPTKDKMPNEQSAPRGVATLKKATCFLISDRGREVDSRDDVKAKAVGATREFFLNHRRKERSRCANICVL